MVSIAPLSNVDDKSFFGLDVVAGVALGDADGNDYPLELVWDL